MATQVFAKKQGSKFRGEYSITLFSHCVGSLSNILNLLPLFNIRNKYKNVAVLHTEHTICMHVYSQTVTVTVILVLYSAK